MAEMAEGIDLSRAVWRKSTRSNNGGACVEVATNLPGVVAVRDSKDREGTVLVVSANEWRAFLGGVRDGSSGRSNASALRLPSATTIAKHRDTMIEPLC